MFSAPVTLFIKPGCDGSVEPAIGPSLALGCGGVPQTPARCYHDRMIKPAVLFALAGLLAACSDDADGGAPFGAAPSDAAAHVDGPAQHPDAGDAWADGDTSANADGKPPDAAHDDGASSEAALHDSTPSEATPQDAHTPGMLDTSVVSLIVEPEGVGTDDEGSSYTDKNYWNFCVPGAATVALYYVKPDNVTAWPAGHFKEPKNAPSTIPADGTYWESADNASGYPSVGRAYLMYLAMQVNPPSYTTPGITPFDSYPTPGAGATDLRNAMNWEASGHAADWNNFHYTIVAGGALSESTLHHDVQVDIDGGYSIVVFVDTGYLPNWSRSLGHAIAVVGYDDSAHTYSYADTCGKPCNGSPNSKNGGINTIDQPSLFNAIVANGAGYVWYSL